MPSTSNRIAPPAASRERSGPSGPRLAVDRGPPAAGQAATSIRWRRPQRRSRSPRGPRPRARGGHRARARSKGRRCLLEHARRDPALDDTPAVALRHDRADPSLARDARAAARGPAPMMPIRVSTTRGSQFFPRPAAGGGPPGEWRSACGGVERAAGHRITSIGISSSRPDQERSAVSATAPRRPASARQARSPKDRPRIRVAWRRPPATYASASQGWTFSWRGTTAPRILLPHPVLNQLCDDLRQVYRTDRDTFEALLDRRTGFHAQHPKQGRRIEDDLTHARPRALVPHQLVHQRPVTIGDVFPDHRLRLLDRLLVAPHASSPGSISRITASPCRCRAPYAHRRES